MVTPQQIRWALQDRLARDRPGQRVGPLTELKGGWANSLYVFDGSGPGSPDGTLVLKMYSAHARGQEYADREWRALTGLRSVDYPVPLGVLYESDATVLGQPFIVMEHVQGPSFGAGLEAAGPDPRTRLIGQFTAHLVALHALDPRLLHPQDVPEYPYGFIDRELEHLRLDDETSPHSNLAGVIRWLEERRRDVPCERPVILHRDYHPWNVLVERGEQMRVIDWDWQVGDPRFDLAWTCALIRRSGWTALSDAVRDHYVRQVGNSVTNLAYFDVLATTRWLLNVLPAAAQRADFRAFLVDPVRRAQRTLAQHTGLPIEITL